MKEQPSFGRPTLGWPTRAGWLILVALAPFHAAAQEPEDAGSSDARTESRASAAKEPNGDEAEAASESRDEVKPVRLFEELLVVGAPEAARAIPGSAHLITREDLERQEYSDIHRVLRQTPGINIQEEDGYGLRPNIGIRGTGVERSQKVTLLEDGVLIAPAPYSAPSAYYSPTAGRMESFEVRKGSGAIRQGPYTNGGAINYLSTSIPDGVQGGMQLATGEDRLRRGRAWAGGTHDRLGWLLETYQLRTDGFKRVDGGGSSGFELEDYLAKLRFGSRPGARLVQALELKAGKTKHRGDETYLGLSREDFDRDPYRRYASSAGDNIVTDHELLQLSYFVQPSARVNLTATAYRNDFYRNWFKLEKVGGVGVAAVLAHSNAFPELVSILRGEIDSGPGALSVRNNRRDYFSEGLQLVASVKLGAASKAHELEVGLRLHRDQEDRFQEEDLFEMSNGRRRLTERGFPGSHANRIADAEAVAVFVQDTFTLGKWTWSPGVRVESIDLMRRDFGDADPARAGTSLARRANDLTEVLPGFGVGYRLSEASNLFLGVHRGFSPPSPSSTQQVQAEESVNYEAGWKYRSNDTDAELVAFFNDYENLLGNDTVSSGGDGTGDQFNGGEVEVRGIEAGFGFVAGRGARSRTRFPIRLTYTYTEAEFRDSFETSFGDWQPRVERGDELPYLPGHQLFAGASAVARRWALHVNGSYTSKMRTRSGRGAIPEGERIDSRLLFDLKAEYTVRERVKFWSQLLNATDEVYVAARRPAGLRPGRPRALLFGLSFEFQEALR